MSIQPLLPAGAIAANMAELKSALQPQQALVEANRCLYCFDAPCIMACPAGIDIPAFIRQIAQGNAAAAARTILTANVLGGSCARVCPTAVLCEGACVLEDRDARPVEIGRLQRFATDLAAKRGLGLRAASTPSVPTTGRGIAVIGAGPAGLACAAELARLGHRVVIFEQRDRPGGLDTFGIAYYKMRPEISLAEAELVRTLGVEIRCGVTVGRDIDVADLENDYAAIFVGIGLGATGRLGIPGEDLPEVVDALDFIARIRTEPMDGVPVGRRVVVIGGGNTAIDAATQALRLGAEQVTLAYRRREADMPAYDFETARARSDGTRLAFNIAPLEVLGQDGHVSGVRFVRTQAAATGTPGSVGRPEPIPGTEFIEACDLVLKANGQERQLGLLRQLFPALQVDAHGAVACDPLTGRTNMPHVFSGGDCANGGREVVNAVGEGVKAAYGIHAFLSGEAVAPPAQTSRLGASTGATGSGLLNPIRVRELEAALGQ